MTLTRSQLGETPKKAEYPGFVETPTRRTRGSRQSTAPESKEPNGAIPSSSPNGSTGKANARDGTILTQELNGKASKPKKSRGSDHTHDQKRDPDPHYEFGGPWGVSAMMIGFPLLMWYMWIGATFYDGRLPLPDQQESISHFLLKLTNLVYIGAFPSLKAWSIYWTFFVFEGICYLYLPGITVKGKPLKHEGGKQLDYFCSGSWSFYVTLVLAVILHITGIFKLYTIIDEFGPIMTVAIISGFLVSIVAYVSALYRGVEHRMTGSLAYDFFMGAELNPRMFTLLDFKMFFEVRLPWFILFLLTCGTAARQYEIYGYVSGEVGFMLLAHFLYANACAKAEECIATTWDMYYEKWGFMLIFWNLAGVPLTYCHSTLYLANHDPSTYKWNPVTLSILYVAYLFVYWVWDTCNGQKNNFRQQERGTFVQRKTFPQLPWQVLVNPKTIKTKTGDSILVDGWYKYARKVHYTCDLFYALTWGLITGFRSPFPWFYAAFFVPMILHRAYRDNQRCQERYQDAWTEYRRQVPYIFIPFVF